MQNNRFYANRKEIGELAKAQGVTINIACIIYAKEHWGDYGWQGELDAFMQEVRKYEQAKDKPTKATEHMDKNKDGHINTADLFE